VVNLVTGIFCDIDFIDAMKAKIRVIDEEFAERYKIANDC
jgi:hypothetical protein